MNKIILMCIIAYFVIGILLALLSLYLCALRCGKKFLKEKAFKSNFSNQTLIIVNNITFWIFYFPSLLNELEIIHIPDWMNFIKE